MLNGVLGIVEGTLILANITSCTPVVYTGHVVSVRRLRLLALLLFPEFWRKAFHPLMLRLTCSHFRYCTNVPPMVYSS